MMIDYKKAKKKWWLAVFVRHNNVCEPEIVKY